jgi:uncharacterized protein (TIGR04222 family)
MDTFITAVFPSDIFLWPYVYWGIVGAPVLVLVALVVWIHVPAAGTDEVRPDLYETAELRDPRAAITTAIVRLVLLGVLRLDSQKNSLEVSGPLPDGSHPVEEAVYRAVATGGWRDRIYHAATPAAGHSAARLRSLGLYPGRIRSAIGMCVGAATIGLAFAMFHIITVRLQHPAVVPGGQPVKDMRSQGAGFCCVVASVAMVFAGICLGAGLACWPTRRGLTVFLRTRREHPLQRTDDLALVVALYGLGPLETRGHAALKNFLDPPPPDPPVV